MVQGDMRGLRANRGSTNPKKETTLEGASTP